MKQVGLWCLLAVLAVTVLPASAAQRTSALDQSTSDFNRNITLGPVLQLRQGTTAELDELRIVADRGMKAAREAVAADPKSADAQYGLGSWLLYGYQVVQVDETTFDAEGNATTEPVIRVVQGLADDPGEGLAALKRASELDPTNGEYVLDYGAALLDYDEPEQAETVLKGIWAGKPDLAVQYKMRAGLLLSTIAEGNGDLDGAREWIYSALSLDPEAAPAVDRLREIDAAAFAAAAAAATAAQTEEEQPETVEPTPSMPEEGQEEAPGAEGGAYGEEQQGTGAGEQQPSAEGYQEAPAGSYQQQPGSYQEPPSAGYQEPPAESYQEPPASGYQEPPAESYQEPPAESNPEPPAESYPEAPQQSY